MSYCIKCGHRSEPSAKFCINCGSTLYARSAGSTIPPPPDPSLPAGTLPGPSRAASNQDFNISSWLAKNKMYVLGALGIICIIWVINYFFFKSHPEKDGKAIARAECDCEEKRMDDLVKKKKDFLQNYNTYHFTAVYEIRQKLDSFDNDAQEEFNNCMQQVNMLRDEKAQHYLKDRNSLTLLSQQYYSEKQLCQVESEDLTKITAEISNKIMTFSPYMPPAPQPPVSKAEEPVKVDTVETKATGQTEVSNEILTDEIIRSKITSLFNQENNIGASPEDVSKLLAYFQFPLDRYYEAKNVNAERLMKIYADSYFKLLASHHLKDFENRITISRQTDGSVKVIVGCTFEFSTAQSPEEKRSRTVFNVYVFASNGQIKSVYQLL